MASTLTEAVCVWLDDVSDPGRCSWIVSLDRLDETGGAVTTTTLDVYPEDDEAGATEAARAEASKRGLPLYRKPEHGPAELVEG